MIFCMHIIPSYLLTTNGFLQQTHNKLKLAQTDYQTDYTTIVLETTNQLST
jgi:hypothetical protein